MPSDEDERFGDDAPNLPCRLDDPVVLERVHAGNADQPGPRPPRPGAHAVAEAQVHDRRLVAARTKRRGHVLEAQRLDAKERPEPETFVAGVRADQEDVHGRRLGL